jgi:hypothetical protein
MKTPWQSLFIADADIDIVLSLLSSSIVDVAGS